MPTPEEIERRKQRKRELNKRWWDAHKDDPDFKERNRQKSKRHYQNNKEHYHRKAREWDKENREAMLRYKRKSGRKARMAAIKKGICPVCLKRPRKVSSQRCSECYKQHRIISNRTYKKRSANGKCVKCGDELGEEVRLLNPGGVYCPACHTKHKVYDNRYKHGDHIPLPFSDRKGQ